MPDLERVNGKDICGNSVTLTRTQPHQLSLFQTFLPMDDPRYSNSIELYDAIPKHFPAKHQAALRINETFLPNLERSFEHRGQTFNMTLRPARLTDRDGMIREYYPSFRDELVEEALRKIACERGNGVFLDGQAGVQFTLYELQKELALRDHAINLPDLLDSLKVCNLASMSITRDDTVLIQSSIFPVLLLSSKSDWLTSPKTARCFVLFHPLVTASMNQISYRQYDYLAFMSYKHRLSRWLHKRLAHNYVQASMLHPYHISLSTILRDSGAYLPPRRDNRPKEVNIALQELREKQVVMEFRAEVKRGPRKTILDIVYILTPDFSFIQEAKKANARVKQITEVAAGQQPRLNFSSDMVFQRGGGEISAEKLAFQRGGQSEI